MSEAPDHDALLGQLPPLTPREMAREDPAVSPGSWWRLGAVSMSSAALLVNRSIGHDFCTVEMIKKEVREKRMRAFLKTEDDGRRVVMVCPADAHVLAADIQRDMDRRGMPPRQRFRHRGVYFIACGSFVKIGKTSCARARFDTLQSTNPYDIECLAVIQCADDAESSRVESEHHRRFAALRHRGEWFRHEGELAEYIKTLPEVDL